MNSEKHEEDIYALGGAAGGAAKDYDGYTYEAVERERGGIDASTLMPMFGGVGGAGAPGLGGAVAGMPQPEYLHYQPKQWYERLSYNTGFSYLFGFGTGGIFGIGKGFFNSPSNKFRIRINSMLNKSGHHGSRFGNALGAVAMLYSCMEEATDRMHVEEFVPQINEDLFNPLFAAALTGVLYKSTQGPKTMVLAGVLGGLGAAGFRAVSGLRSQGAATGKMFF